MRLVITQNVTVDGAVEMLDDWFDPADQDPELAAETRRQDETCDAVLLGRQTFEDFRGYWPAQVGQDTTGVADQLNKVRKYVVTRTLTEPDWQNTTLLSGDPVDEVRRLKDRPGDDIVLTGSITLAHLLIPAGRWTSTGCSSTRRCRDAAAGSSRTASPPGCGCAPRVSSAACPTAPTCPSADRRTFPGQRFRRSSSQASTAGSTIMISTPIRLPNW